MKKDKKFSAAKKLRNKGYSLAEISAELRIAKGTASAWLSNVSLSKKALKRLERRGLLGRLKAAESIRRIWDERRVLLIDEAKQLLAEIPIEKSHHLLFCALLFECEGAKDVSTLEFINSNPLIISGFLSFLRNSFPLDESKFRITMHLHEYHNERVQKKFWSKVTGLKESQFTKTYHKPNGGKNYRQDYPGCIRVRYCDYRIATKLQFVAREVLKNYGSVR